ncbi:MAG TPA: DMT family transporter [Streptosporangiaceae bacterium]
MLAVAAALVSAVFYGSGDFAGGLATRRASVIRVALLTQSVSATVIGIAVWSSGAAPPAAEAVVWGMVGGLAGACGALALLAGFRHAVFSVAAPLSAVGAAGFSVLAGLLLGERPSALALTGIVLALPAIVGVSASARARPAGPPAPGGPAPLGEPLPVRGSGPSGADETAPDPAAARRRFTPGGVSYGLVAGACFALLFIALNRAGSGSGFWPVFCSQTTGLATITCVAVVTREFRLPASGSRWLAGLAGLGSAPGTIFYFVATHRGQLAVAAVISSLYPAVTIMLARVLLGERLTAVRLAGLVLAGASVALIAAGGAR